MIALTFIDALVSVFLFIYFFAFVVVRRKYLTGAILTEEQKTQLSSGTNLSTFKYCENTVR
jgi:hypothetical protein